MARQEPHSYDQLLRLLKDRRSVRRWQQREIPQDVLKRILEAARWAPSAGNRQAWRMHVIRDHELLEQLAEAVRDRCQQLVSESRLGQRLQGYVRHFHRFADAPLVIAATFRSGPDLLQGAGARAESLPRPQLDGLSSVAAAVTQLLLAAHALGLGACWMTGPLVAADVVEPLLKVSRGWELAALVPMGYPDEEPEAPPRRGLDQLVRYPE